MGVASYLSIGQLLRLKIELLSKECVPDWPKLWTVQGSLLLGFNILVGPVTRVNIQTVINSSMAQRFPVLVLSLPHPQKIEGRLFDGHLVL